MVSILKTLRPNKVRYAVSALLCYCYGCGVLCLFSLVEDLATLCHFFFSTFSLYHFFFRRQASSHHAPACCSAWPTEVLGKESTAVRKRPHRCTSLLLQQARQWHHPFCCLHASEWGYRPATQGLELTIFASQLVFAPMLPLKDEEQVVQMHHNGVFHWVVSHRRASDSTASIYYRLGTDHFWLQASGTWFIPETRIYPSYLLLEDLTRLIIAFRSVNSLSWHQELHQSLSSKRSRLRSVGPVLRRYTTHSRLPPGTEPTFLPF